jgi:hypothetical protein
MATIGTVSSRAESDRRHIKSRRYRRLCRDREINGVRTRPYANGKVVSTRTFFLEVLYHEQLPKSRWVKPHQKMLSFLTVSYLKFSQAPLKAVVSKVYNYINRIVSVILLKLYMECD